MKKEIKSVQVNTGNAEMVLYKDNINLAIEKSWESLYFSTNEDDFSWLTNGKNIIVLTTRGDVIISKEGKILECGNDIRYLLDSGVDLYENDIIQSKNWFSIELGEVIGEENYIITDEFSFEYTPKTIKEIEKLLIDIFNTHYQ